MSTYPRPPAVPGLPEIRPADLWWSMWWIERGFILEMRRGPRRAYAASGALLGVLMPELLIFAVGVVTPHRRGTRYYISPSRDAVLTVRAARDGWHVENHVSAHPGTEQGKALRRAGGAFVTDGSRRCRGGDPGRRSERQACDDLQGAVRGTCRRRHGISRTPQPQAGTATLRRQPNLEHRATPTPTGSRRRRRRSRGRRGPAGSSSGSGVLRRQV